MAKGNPQTVFAVDGHAIRATGIVAGVPKDAFVADGAAGFVEIKGADLFAGGVDVIHRGRVAGPDDAIGVGDRGEFLLNAQVGVQAVEGAFGALFQVDATRPEAASRIAFAVIEAVVRQVGLGVANRGAESGGLVQEMEAGVACPDEAAFRPWHNGADSLADVPDLFLTGGGVQGDDFVGLNVHIQQTIQVPKGAFAPN